MFFRTNLHFKISKSIFLMYNIIKLKWLEVNNSSEKCYVLNIDYYFAFWNIKFHLTNIYRDLEQERVTFPFKKKSLFRRHSDMKSKAEIALKRNESGYLLLVRKLKALSLIRNVNIWKFSERHHINVFQFCIIYLFEICTK